MRPVPHAELVCASCRLLTKYNAVSGVSCRITLSVARGTQLIFGSAKQGIGGSLYQLRARFHLVIVHLASGQAR
jgi:hypothetical protein